MIEDAAGPGPSTLLLETWIDEQVSHTHTHAHARTHTHTHTRSHTHTHTYAARHDCLSLEVPDTFYFNAPNRGEEPPEQFYQPRPYPLALL